MNVSPRSNDSPTHQVRGEVFTPFDWSMKEIKESVPPHLFVRSTSRSLAYLARDLVMAAALWKAATWIDPYFHQLGRVHIIYEVFRWVTWLT